MRIPASLLYRYFALLCLALTAQSTQAQTLNPLSVQAYIAALPATAQLADRLQRGAQGTALYQAMQYGSSSGFAPHSNGVKWLTSHDQQSLNQLSSAVNPAGFASPQSWARVGDRVALTYAALRLEQRDQEWAALIAQAQAMPPELRALLPDSLRHQLDAAEHSLQMLRQISPDEKALVRPHYTTLDQVYRRLSTPP